MSVRAKHQIMTRGSDASVAEDGELSSFLFTSESVGEGHPGELCNVGS